MSAGLAPLRNRADKAIVEVIRPEDMLCMPDQGRGYELIDGQLKERIVSKQSCLAGNRFNYFLTHYVETTGRGWAYGADMGFRIFPFAPRNVRFADAAFVSFERDPIETFQDEGHCTKAPEVVVESVSPNDNAGEAYSKIADWLEAGVKLVWEVYPDSKTVRAHRASGPIQVYREGDTLTADDILPGFSVPVADLFKRSGMKP